MLKEKEADQVRLEIPPGHARYLSSDEAVWRCLRQLELPDLVWPSPLEIRCDSGTVAASIGLRCHVLKRLGGDNCLGLYAEIR